MRVCVCVCGGGGGVQVPGSSASVGAKTNMVRVQGTRCVWPISAYISRGPNPERTRT